MTTERSVILAIGISFVLVIGALFLVSGRGTAGPADNVRIVDGRQIIELAARGGYVPGKSVAKAGVPTTLRVETKGTFDCSSAIRIPALGIGKNLPSSGTTDIDLGTPASGVLRGTCAMGMYPFEIDFRS